MKRLIFCLFIATACHAAQKSATDPQKCDPSLADSKNAIMGGVGGGYLYAPQEIRPGCWIWAIDVKGSEAAHQRARKENDRKAALYLAMRTRVVTDAEWAEIVKFGNDLLIPTCAISCWQDYKLSEIEHRINEAYIQQFRLRLSQEPK